jgi:hypothetical protein
MDGCGAAFPIVVSVSLGEIGTFKEKGVGGFSEYMV